MGSEPITVSIRREVDPDRVAEATVWAQTGVNLANRYPGFLGSGWVRAGETSRRIETVIGSDMTPSHRIGVSAR